MNDDDRKKIEELKIKREKIKAERLKRKLERLNTTLEGIELLDYEKEIFKELAKEDIVIDTVLDVIEQLKSKNDYILKEYEEMQERYNKLKHSEHVRINGNDDGFMPFNDFVPF